MEDCRHTSNKLRSWPMQTAQRCCVLRTYAFVCCVPVKMAGCRYASRYLRKVCADQLSITLHQTTMCNQITLMSHGSSTLSFTRRPDYVVCSVCNKAGQRVTSTSSAQYAYKLCHYKVGAANTSVLQAHALTSDNTQLQALFTLQGQMTFNATI